MEKLVNDILVKKELSNLGKNIVLEEINKYFKRNPKIKKKLEEKSYNKKSEEYKLVIKDVRKTLREIYGVFIQKDYSKRNTILKKIDDREEIINKLLKLHQSTKERLPYYKDIYKKIFEITGKQKKVLDLACGLNPISYDWLGYKPEYVASDIAQKDLNFIQDFFNKYNINGKTIKIDLVSDIKQIDQIKTDICFLLKSLDTLEVRQKNISKNLILRINTKWLILSFPKKSIGGKKEISNEKRAWIRKFLKNNSLSYSEFEVSNEYFIVVKK